jgi:ABC-type amino acid transport substrate-binding protein
MHLIGTQSPIKQETQPETLSTADQARKRLDIIRERGVIRVGYFSNSLPYAFRNTKAELVGYDMEIMHELANDLNLKVEYSHIKQRGQEVAMLSDGRIDIVIGAIAITPLAALEATFTKPYLYHTAGLVVLDKFRDDFSSMEKIHKMKDLTLAVPKSTYYSRLIKTHFPQAKQLEVTNAREYFKGMHKEAHAFIYSTEAASAWAMLYPEYTVLVPKGLKFKVPAAYKLPADQFAFAEFMNTWLDLKKDNGFMDKVYQYWIFGIDPKEKEPRWSVVRNVFGWDI